jgi:hypothetical protein
VARAAPSILIFAVLTLAAACGGSAEPAAETPSAARIGNLTLQPLQAGRDVTAADGRFALRVPADWVAANAPVAELSYRSPESGEQLSFSIVREELADIQRAQAYAEAGRRRIGELYQNVITLSLTPVRVGSHEAYRWVYTAGTASGEFFFYQLFLVDGGDGFVMTGLAPMTTDFAHAQSVFDSIAGSITLARG